MAEKVLHDISEKLGGNGADITVANSATISGTLTLVSAPGANKRVVVKAFNGHATTTDASVLSIRAGSTAGGAWGLAASSVLNYGQTYGGRGWRLPENTALSLNFSAAVLTNTIGVVYTIEDV